MVNSVKTVSMIAKEALMILENKLVAAKLVHRGYDEEYARNPNGYKIGTTITIRKPTDFTVRDGATASNQDVTEGSTTIVVNKQKGIDFQFTSQELALSMNQLSERVIKPAMVQLANQIDRDILNLYNAVPSWVGTPGQVINSFADFALGPQRLDEFGVPEGEERFGLLSPSDNWGMLGSQTALYIQDAAKGAYRSGALGDIGGVNTYSSQNVYTHTVGNYGGTGLVNGGSQGVTYDTVKDSFQQTLVTDGWTASRTGLLKAGDVFTIAGVNAVNPVTKAVLPFARQFVVLADANSDGSGNSTLTISPPIIASGAQQTVDAVPADNAAITVVGTANTSYRQNIIGHKNAFALVTVPMEAPQGAVNVSRQSYKGINVRLVPYYDGTNDISKWRLDVLYGVKCIDPRLATRISGSP